MAWGEMRFHESSLIPKGKAFLMVEDNTWMLHPYDMLIQLGRGRLPYETSRSLGLRELERDRRRYPRQNDRGPAGT